MNASNPLGGPTDRSGRGIVAGTSMMNSPNETLEDIY